MNAVELIKRIIRNPNGQEAIKLYNENVFIVRAIIYRFRVKSCDVDDLINETFTRVFSGLKDLANPSSLREWISAITHNVCKDYKRQKELEEKALLEYLTIEKIYQSRNEFTNIEDIVEENILSLPKLIVYLHYRKKMSIDSICETLNLSRKVVKEMIKKVKKGMDEDE